VAQPAGSARGQPNDFSLGVLFVHGIGEQRQYSTLSRFGGALQRWLRQWEEGRQPAKPRTDRVAPPTLVDVLAVESRPDDRKAPAYAEITAGPAKKWLLAEAWWAPEVTPPKFRDFIRWVLPMFPWLAAEYAVAAGQRVYRPDPSPSLHNRKPSWIERGSLAGLVWLASPLIAVASMVACLLLALLQRLPVVGKRVSALTVNLVKGVGDSYLFAHDALARTAMVQRIRRDLDWLRAKGCERVAIVAHSQGAALCHDLLRDDNHPRVDLLVTVGSGVQRLNGFRQLYRNATLRSIGWWSIGAMAALAAGMVLVASALGPAVPGFWAWSGITLVVAGALIPGMYNSSTAPSQAQTTRPDDEARHSRTAVFLGTAGACLGALALLIAGVLAGGEVGIRLGVGGALTLMGIVGYAVAYRRVETQIETPPQLALPRDAFDDRDDTEDKDEWVHWIDYYSTADPVPNGPLVTWTSAEPPKRIDPDDPEAVHPRPRLVYNLRSVQGDHSFYFDNIDEFVSQLTLDLARKAGHDLGRLKDRSDLLWERAGRRWRTSCRSDLRNLLLGAGLFGALAISLRLGGGSGWAGLGADLGVRTDGSQGLVGRLSLAALDWLAKLPFLGGLKNIDLLLFSGLVVAALAVAVGAIALGWLWSMWDRHAITEFFRRYQIEPVRSSGLAALLLRSPMVAFLTLAGLLLAGTAAATQRYGGAWWLWLPFLLVGVFTAVLTVKRWQTCFGPQQEPASTPTAPKAGIGGARQTATGTRR
jgi:hypothetical protein